MRIYCIRHGESTNNALEGSTDYHLRRSFEPTLTSRGVLQAEAAAEHLQEYIPQRHSRQPIIYTSYMVRAVQTASTIAKKLQLPLQAWRDIHERGGCVDYSTQQERFVCVPGHGRDYYAENFPHLELDNTIDASGWNTLRQLENQRGCYQRAKRILKELMAKHGSDDRPVILVSHRMFIGALATAVLQGHHKASDRIYSHNVGVTCIAGNNEQCWIDFHNQYNFLPNSLRTDIPHAMQV